MNNIEVMYSSKTDMWETPQDLFDKLDAEFHFDLDVCATSENAKCKRYYTPEIDGLQQNWGGQRGAIPRMAARSASGCAGRFFRPVQGVQRLLCCFLRELIQGGSMNTF